MTRRAIIIAAGRGSRLSHHTDDRPKCMVEVDGASILEHQLSAYRTHGVDDFHLVRGYRAEDIVVPGATYHSNADWERNNILLSLFCAAPALEGPLLASYSDILFTERTVAAALGGRHDITLVVCWPQYVYSERILVTAALVDVVEIPEDERSPSPSAEL